MLMAHTKSLVEDIRTPKGSVVLCACTAPTEEQGVTKWRKMSLWEGSPTFLRKNIFTSMSPFCEFYISPLLRKRVARKNINQICVTDKEAMAQRNIELANKISTSILWFI